MQEGNAGSIGAAVTALLASSATLVCCVLPAVLVSLGAGAVLVGLVAAVPQLVWLSEHKLAVFGIAALFLAVSGAILWRGWRLPCPVDSELGRKCMRWRRASRNLYFASLAMFLISNLFAFVLPQLI